MNGATPSVEGHFLPSTLVMVTKYVVFKKQIRYVYTLSDLFML